jgi:hypothetical protein
MVAEFSQVRVVEAPFFSASIVVILEQRGARDA